MLARKHRVRTNAEFQRVYKSGKTLKTALFRIKTVENGLEHPRMAIVIAKKLQKSAVRRNRKKRQITAVMREIHPQIQKNADIVLLPNPEAMDADFHAIRTDVISGFQRIGFLPREQEQNAQHQKSHTE